MDKPAPDPLQVVRNRIDAIDEEMHRLLIDRASVIAELIRIKGTSKPGGAFRPDREADMMRRIALRHEGKLPLATVEHIWREIITAFTAMQAPFGIVAGPASDVLAMRDVIRFYFGFSVPVETVETNEAAVARVASSSQDLAIIAADTDGRWWSGLTGTDAPKVFAKLPFIEIPDRPADFPAYVVGPSLKETHDPDIRLLAAKDAPGLEEAVRSFGGAVAARAGGETLLELPVAASLEAIDGEAGRAIAEAETLGGFCQPIRYVAERVA
jgi:chorismate mutase/prephenate dehydratase